MPKRFLVFSLITTFFFAHSAYANLALIRDAETEKFLRDLANPIFDAADLDSKNVKIYIVNDNSINAFVSGGQNVFINTGLIRKYTTPDALIGVIAHETGHITGGHLARSHEAAKEAGGAMLLSYLLGIGALISGAPEAGQALILSGSQTAQRLYMKFTREQEEAADQYAIRFLDKLSYPATGLIRLLEFFESEMIGYKGQIDEYLLSHPISQKRIDLIKTRTANKNFSDKKINQHLQKQMDRVSAKLEGFTDKPDELLARYKNKNDENANYVKSIALFRKGKIDESLKILDEIIAKNSSTASESDQSLGFLFDLRGQILFESGRIQDSVIAYNRALKLLNSSNSDLTKISFAVSILTLKTSDKELVQLAIKRLEEAANSENENPFLFKNLATAYDRIHDEGRSLLALSEFNLLIGDKKKAQKFAKDAKEKLDKSAKNELLRADDLIELGKEEEKEAKD